jgi:hypothetical protein
MLPIGSASAIWVRVMWRERFKNGIEIEPSTVGGPIGVSLAQPAMAAPSPSSTTIRTAVTGVRCAL